MSSIRRFNHLLFISLLLFLFLFAIGTLLSLRKPLWNDEIYTQVRTIDSHSYKNLMTLNYGEGSIAPLFYVVQKGICDLARFRFPVEWNQQWHVADPKAQFVMRILPNVSMSLAIVLIFYFFAKQYSVKAGIYALLTALSSLIVWDHWVEARPYNLWFLLTTIQLILFLKIFQEDKVDSKQWRNLGIVHWLLAFCMIMSLPQIMITSVILWMMKERRASKYILLTLIPSAVCLFYYFHSPIIWYGLYHPLSLILANFPLERWAIVLGYAVCAHYVFRNNCVDQMKGKALLYFTGLSLLATGAILIIIAIKAIPGAEEVPNRIFINLSPLAIFTTCLFPVLLLRLREWSILGKWNIFFICGGLVAIRFVRTITEIILMGIY